MTKQIALAILLCSTTAHYVIAMVMFVYARHQVRYLSIAWIMAILAFLSTFICSLCLMPETVHGFLQPAALLLLAVVCYLQSIYPLSFVMPGYLQWQRMVKYASPVMALIVLYVIPLLLGKSHVVITNARELLEHLVSYDILLRLASLVLSLVYIINIFRLPRRLTHKELPGYMIAYSVCLGLSAVFYAVVCVLRFNLLLATIYVICFTVLNLYLSLRTLETMALELPKPTMTAVEQNPSETDLEQAQRDFNELNQKRFERVEYWMQHNREAWKDNTFGRDQLCRETGINRHLLLQCVRSQGYNNVHDYLSFYRITELKRMIESGEVTSLTECQDAGFGTTKTARNCFLRFEGAPLEDYLLSARHREET
ncbi:MAG: hypothetical protein LUC33_04995 [Prevotellaceae bacterium]|nr:hypothetical protein [Prevotellaceae bacterium]